MTRALRIQFENALYHVIARGDAKRQIFLNDSDYIMLIAINKQAIIKFNIKIIAYVLMPNHYHLIIATPDANLSRAMHFINTKYAVSFSRKYNIPGHIFQGRYKAFLINDNDYLLESSRYIHLNPLRANIVKDLLDYKWSSFPEFLGIEKRDFIDNNIIMKQLSLNKKISFQRYKEYCLDAVNLNPEIEKRKIYGGLILGNKTSTQKIKEKKSLIFYQMKLLFIEN